MAAADRFKVTKLDGLKETSARALAFLECDTRKDIDAKKAFEKLKPKKREDLFNRFEYWIDEGIFDKYFHGFANHPTYHQCWVFRWKDAGAYHRMYGFLYNPRQRTDKGFRVCVLTSHAQKNTEHTNPSELAHAESLRQNIAVISAVKRVFPELN